MGIKELVEQRRKIKANKKLIKEYPFLLPRNVWTDEVSKDYDYSYTLFDLFPEGWKKAFAIDFIKEIKADLVENNYLNEFRILDIKEKYGTLRVYINSIPKKSKIDLIIDKYEDLSMCYCINCGKPVKYVTKGWISYICEDCKDAALKDTHLEGDTFIRLDESYIPKRNITTKTGEKTIDTGIDFKKLWGLENE